MKKNNIISFKTKEGIIKRRFKWIDNTGDDEIIVEFISEEEFQELMESAEFHEHATIVEWPKQW